MIMKALKKNYFYVWYIAASFLVLALVVGFVPQREGNSVRRHISTDVVRLGPEDMPIPIENNTSWSMRAPAISKIIFSNDDQIQLESENLLSFSNNSITLQTTHGAKNVESNTKFAALMAMSAVEVNPFAHTVRAALPVHYGEALNLEGRPVRWAKDGDDAHVAKNSFALSCAVQQTSLERIHSALVARISVPVRAESTLTKARRYMDLVKKAAQRFNLSESLIFAIIQTESDFSPALVSSQSAMGLMQLLPSTAGGEVHRFLHGHSATMTHADLSKPEVNILFGTAYMHLLLTRHLGGVEDEQSRIYCALASYNMGPGRLIRFFGSGRDDAIANINKLTADEVYKQLTTVLPIAETRAYVARVTTRQANFEGI